MPLYIYKYTNPFNGKIYVGSTVNIKHRQACHEFNTSRQKTRFGNALNKYGYESFQFDILEETCPLLRISRENYWINYYGTLGKGGYNSVSADSILISQETREKHRKNSTGRKQSPDTIQKRADKIRQNTINGVPRKSFSEETRQKMSDAVKNRPVVSEETRRRMSKAQTGRIMSPESIKKTADALRGRKQDPDHTRRSAERNRGRKQTPEEIKRRADSNRGKIHTEETKKRMSESKRGKVFTEAHKLKLSEARKAYYARIRGEA